MEQANPQAVGLASRIRGLGFPNIAIKLWSRDSSELIPLLRLSQLWATCRQPTG